MKVIEWSEEKNQKLKQTRRVSFEEMAERINSEAMIDRIDHPNQKKYPGQEMFVVKFNNYIYLIPFVEDAYKYFLKTIIPNRKATKKYL